MNVSWAYIVFNNTSVKQDHAYFFQGGLKAVLWTDTFQVGVMFAGLFAIVIKGMSDVGGLKEAWKNFDASGRVDWDEYVT